MIKRKSIIATVTSLLLMFICVFQVNSEETTDKIKVMPLGDSITDGYSTLGGYRQPLCNRLEENGFSGNFDFVGPNWGGNCYDPQHAGYSGYSIDNIAQADSISGARTGLSSFIDWLMESNPADVVMLQIGTNDILSYYDLDNIGVRLENLVDTILNYIPEDGMLYLATIPCMDATDTLYINEYYFTPDSMDECVDNYNTEIRRIAAEKQAQGENVKLADINSILTKADLYDGVHPTEGGYNIMSDYWYDVLMSYLDGKDIPQPTTEPVTEPTIETTTELTTEPTTTEILLKKGDVNVDGHVNVSDIAIMNGYLLNKNGMTSDGFSGGDINENGIIDIFDSVLLRRMILNM